MRIADIEVSPGKHKRVETTIELSTSSDGRGHSHKGLGFLSTGQLQVIALCLFLARASRSSTPFRFIVIDDPVQSLDELRIENLARVLDAITNGSLPSRSATGAQIEISARQVIVLTHDERLKNTIERLGIVAARYSIDRSAESRIVLSREQGAVEGLLKEANKVISTNAPKWLKDRAVGALCRSAIEAECYPAFARRVTPDSDPEMKWDEVEKTRERVAFALDCDPGAISSAVNQEFSDLLELLNQASHSNTVKPSTCSPADLLDRTRAALISLEAKLGLRDY